MYMFGQDAISLLIDATCSLFEVRFYNVLNLHFLAILWYCCSLYLLDLPHAVILFSCWLEFQAILLTRKYCNGLNNIYLASEAECMIACNRQEFVGLIITQSRKHKLRTFQYFSSNVSTFDFVIDFN